MDTTDRNDSHLPARLPSSSSHLPAASAFSRPAYDLATVSPTVQISPQGVLRGLARNWWRILLLWAGVSLPLVYFIYIHFQPTYEASSTVLAEPAQHTLFGRSETAGAADAIDRYISTQIASILSRRVLFRAVGDTTVANLPVIQNARTNATDALTEVKNGLRVKGKENTYYITVAFESTNAVEAAAIVNAVVAAYLQDYESSKLGANANLIRRLDAYLKDLATEKAKLTKDLVDLVDKGRVDPDNLRNNNNNNNNNSGSDRNNSAQGRSGESPPTPTTTKDVTIEQYRNLKTRILEKEFELKRLGFILETRLENSQNQEAEIDNTAEAGLGLTKEQIEARIKDVFKRDPAVAALIGDIVATTEELDHTIGVVRKGYDPARKAGEKRKDQLTAKYNSLWDERYNEIRQSVMAELTAATAQVAGPASPNTLTTDELRARMKLEERELALLNEAFRSMDFEKNATQSETFRADQLTAEIGTLNNQYDTIHQKLEDIKFSTDKDVVKIELIDRAEVLKAPTSNKRLRYAILAPGLVLCMLLGLFALLEVKAERVADPDALSTRVQSEVFSLPPLPMVRASNKLNGPAEDDQIDRFIQRLDHLRFAVCGDHPEVGLGRCVLITSAIGGEGKTTLAAQLAARCGHAGHSTLLIDADLRRGALCPLLDIPEGLGLSDVLKDEANVEDVVIPVQGGTFHLLCAGTPVPDTSRIFQGRNFGMMIARLRQMYDLIIIDSPPVLPVPDGLILGRWTDGAVLASRYDISRAPQVERARRQLNIAGIPVLGTVINGMKSSDSYYGRYSYSRGRSGYSEPDESPTS